MTAVSCIHEASLSQNTTCLNYDTGYTRCLPDTVNLYQFELDLLSISEFSQVIALRACQFAEKFIFITVTV